MAKAPPGLAQRRPSADVAPPLNRRTPLKERRTRGRAREDGVSKQGSRCSRLVLRDTGIKNKPHSPEDLQLALDTASLLEIITSPKKWPGASSGDRSDDTDQITKDAYQSHPCQATHSIGSLAVEADETQRTCPSYHCEDDPTCRTVIKPLIRDLYTSATLLSLETKFHHLKSWYYADKNSDHEIWSGLESLSQTYYAMAEFNAVASTQLWLAVVSDRANHTDAVVDYLAQILTGIPGKHFSDADKFQLEKLIVKHGFQVWCRMLSVARGAENRPASKPDLLHTVMNEGFDFVQSVLAYVRELYQDRNSWPDIQLEHDTLFHDLLNQIKYQPAPNNVTDEVEHEDANLVDCEDQLPRSAVSLVFQRIRDSPSRRQQLWTSLSRENVENRLRYDSTEAQSHSSDLLVERREHCSGSTSSVDPSRQAISEMPANVSTKADIDRSRRLSEVVTHEEFLTTDTPGGAGLGKLLHSRRLSEERRKGSVSPLYIPSRAVHASMTTAAHNEKSQNFSPQELAATPPLSPRCDATVHAHSPLSQSSAVWDPDSEERSSSSSSRRQSRSRSRDRSGTISPHTIPAPRQNEATVVGHRADSCHTPAYLHRGESLHDELERASREYKGNTDSDSGELDQASEAEQADDEHEEDNSTELSPRTPSSHTSSQRLIYDNRLSALAALEGGASSSRTDISVRHNIDADTQISSRDNPHPKRRHEPPDIPETFSQLLVYKVPSDQGISTSDDSQVSHSSAHSHPLPISRLNWSPAHQVSSPQTPGYEPTRYRGSNSHSTRLPQPHYHSNSNDANTCEIQTRIKPKSKIDMHHLYQYQRHQHQNQNQNQRRRQIRPTDESRNVTGREAKARDKQDRLYDLIGDEYPSPVEEVYTHN